MSIAFAAATPPVAPAPQPARASLTDPEAIRRRMIDDLNAQDRFAAADATIDRDAFLSMGWSEHQVTAHGPRAIEAFINARAARRAM